MTVHAYASTRSFPGPGQVPQDEPGSARLAELKGTATWRRPAALALRSHGPVPGSLSTPPSCSTVPLGPALQSGKTRHCQVSEKLTNHAEPPRAASATRRAGLDPVRHGPPRQPPDVLLSSLLPGPQPPSQPLLKQPPCSA